MFPLAFLLSLVVVAIAREVVRAVRAVRARRRLPPAGAVYFVRRRRGRRFVAQVVEPALPPGVRVVKQREIPALPPCTRLPCFAVVDGAQRVRFVVEVRTELDALRARYNAGHAVDAAPIRSIARAVVHAARGEDDPARLRSSSSAATPAAIPS